MQLLANYPFLHLYLHEGPSPALEAQWRGFVSSPFLPTPPSATRNAAFLDEIHSLLYGSG
jgi:hypothetical protein